MNLIAPGKISGEIFNIIDEAEKYVILVSPYIRISNWPKLISRLQNVLNRGVKVKIYVRDGQQNLDSIDELERLGITPYLIPNLHSKLYFNEKGAVITSMNLLKSSDDYSLEIGHTVEKGEEFEGIVSYYKKFINPFEENKSSFGTTLEDEIYSRLHIMFPKFSIRSNFNVFHLNTGSNQFETRISKQTNGYFFEILTILSGREFEERGELLNKFEYPDNFGLEFLEGKGNSYDGVIGFLDKGIDSKRISNVLNSEKDLVADLVATFIRNVESFKQSLR